MNRRVLLLMTLLASALIAAALTTMIMPAMAAPPSKKFSVIMRDGVVELYQDGKLVKTFKAPEGARGVEVHVGENGKIYLEFTGIELPKKLSVDAEKAREIVLNSDKVKEAVGEDFRIVGVGTPIGKNTDTAIFLVKASDGTCYRISVNLGRRGVESIERTETCVYQTLYLPIF